MGLSNEAVLAGHIGINVSWSGGHHHHRRLNTMPIGGSFLDEYFTRKKIGAVIDSDKIPNPKSSTLDQDLYIAMRALQNAGLPNKVIPYALRQILWETKNFTSPLAKRGWNWAGIKFSKAAQNNVNAFNDKGYAGYRDMDGFASDYKRVLSLAPGKPINANTAQEFLQGLISNHYFQATPQAYASGVNSKVKLVNDFLNKMADPKSDITTDVQNQTKRDAANANKGTGNILDWMKAHPMLTGVGLTAIGLVTLKAVIHR